MRHWNADIPMTSTVKNTAPASPFTLAPVPGRPVEAIPLTSRRASESRLSKRVYINVFRVSSTLPKCFSVVITFQLFFFLLYVTSVPSDFCESSEWRSKHSWYIARIVEGPLRQCHVCVPPRSLQSRRAIAQSCPVNGVDVQQAMRRRQRTTQSRVYAKAFKIKGTRCPA